MNVNEETRVCFILPATGVWSARPPPLPTLILSGGTEETPVTTRMMSHYFVILFEEAKIDYHELTFP